MSHVAMTPQQVAILAQAELCIHTLIGAAGAAAAANQVRLHAAFASCAHALQKAHEETVIDSQRTVSIAAPADVKRLVSP